jgi:hypothetical protein
VKFQTRTARGTGVPSNLESDFAAGDLDSLSVVKLELREVVKLFAESAIAGFWIS